MASKFVSRIISSPSTTILSLRLANATLQYSTFAQSHECIYYVNNDIIILSMFTELLSLTPIIPGEEHKVNLEKKVTYHPE